MARSLALAFRVGLIIGDVGILVAYSNLIMHVAPGVTRMAAEWLVELAGFWIIVCNLGGQLACAQLFADRESNHSRSRNRLAMFFRVHWIAALCLIVPYAWMH